MRNEKSKRDKHCHESAGKFNVAVLTASDSRSGGQGEDESGRIIIEMMEGMGGEIAHYDIVADGLDLIKEKLLYYCDELRVDLVFTTGGTGFGPRDVTPEATESIAEKLIPGIAEAIRWEGLRKTKNAMLSRGISVIRKNSIIINLPGSPRAVKESLGVFCGLIPHALAMLHGEGH